MSKDLTVVTVRHTIKL